MQRLYLVLSLLAAAGICSAQPVSGTVWTGTPDASNADDPANEASTLPNATFTSSGINYNSDVTGYTVGAFLNSPTFSNEHNGFTPTASADNIEVQLVGTITLAAGANTFDIGHDDGLNLSVSGGIGTVLDAPGGTSFVLTPFTITAPSAGNYTFTINYSECCGAPAVLEFTFPDGTTPIGSVPEPSSMVLFGTLAGVGLFLRRRKRA